MGTCLGLFRKKNKTKRHVRLHRCFYFHDEDKVQFELLVDGDAVSSADFITDSYEVWCSSERGSQLLPLDAHSLLASRALQSRKISWSSSTPPSSIDLEWENEGGIINPVPRLKSLRSSSSNIETSSGDCGGESPESLEWDPGTDNDTDKLISEIEQLTSCALQETGAWRYAYSEPL